MAAGYRERFKGENNPNYRNAGWLTCEVCGEQFKHYLSSRRFCSIAWHQRWHGYPVHVCETLHEALHAIGAAQEPTP